VQASELIAKLQRLVRLHGDFRVQPILDEAECDERREVYSVLFAEEDKRFNLYVSLANIEEEEL
jgi:hypothetical protein